MKKPWLVAFALLSTSSSLVATTEGHRLFAGVQPGGSYGSASGFDGDLAPVLGFDLGLRRGWALGAQLALSDPGYSSLDGFVGAWRLDLAALRVVERPSVRWRFGAGYRLGSRTFLGGESDLATPVVLFGSELDLSERFGLRFEGRFLPLAEREDLDVSSRQELNLGVTFGW